MNNDYYNGCNINIELYYTSNVNHYIIAYYVNK